MLAQLSLADFILHEDEVITLELIAEKMGYVHKLIEELQIND